MEIDVGPGTPRLGDLDPARACRQGFGNRKRRGAQLSGIARATERYGNWRLIQDLTGWRKGLPPAEARKRGMLQLHRGGAHNRHLNEQFLEQFVQQVEGTCSGVIAAWHNGKNRSGVFYAAIPWVLQLEDPRAACAITLQLVVAQLDTPTLWSHMVNRIGAQIEYEVKAQRLKTVNRGLFRALSKHFHKKSLAYLLDTEGLAEVGIEHMNWGAEGRATVGSFMLDQLMTSTGLIQHVWDNSQFRKKTLYIVPVPAVLEFLYTAPPTELTPQRSRVSLEPPELWTPDNWGDYSLCSQKGPLLRLPPYALSIEEEVSLSWASADGLHRLAAAANTLQTQPLRIAPALADLAMELWAKPAGRGFFPVTREPIPLPPKLAAGSSEEAWKARNRQAAKHYEDARTNLPQRIAINRLIARVGSLAGKTFYLPVHGDYRGRLYTAGGLSYQGPPFQRAIVQFQRAEPLTEEGLQWVLRAAAHAFHKTTLTFEQRLAWGQENLEMLVAIGQEPFNHLSLVRAADNPWGLLSACHALAQWQENRSTPVGLPIWFDQRCSGLGHLAAALRDEPLALATSIALGPDGLMPPDVYEQIAEDCMFEAGKDYQVPLVGKEWQKGQAQFWLRRGIDRGIVKEACIAMPFGVRHVGLRSMIADQLLPACPSLKPEALFNYVDGPAAYLAQILGKRMQKHLLGNIKAIATWAKDIALSVGRANLPLEFTAPSGLTVRSGERTTSRSSFPVALNGRAFFYAHSLVDKDSKIVPRKLSASILANVVQSWDATVCMNVIGRMESLGLPIAAVHDCFATTPNHAARLHQIAIEELKALHQQPLIEQLAQQWHERYSGHGPLITTPPAPGTLDPERIGSNPMVFN